ncbi:hypothetical protein MuYL_1084 [Mucilaginibacter xinganensis]|uniref:Uncharacterized protein n=1 Tax=Mucilaginibacter xinganensis TaxID=1234841 RepID=A0A223NTI7_9SPHI|nr:hypothetical protein MuYL_1084 [Mucilaginibacter xinganensis]
MTVLVNNTVIAYCIKMFLLFFERRHVEDKRQASCLVYGHQGNQAGD